MSPLLDSGNAGAARGYQIVSIRFKRVPFSISTAHWDGDGVGIGMIGGRAQYAQRYAFTGEYQRKI